VLAAHIEAGGGIFRGIRNTSALDASPEIPTIGRHNPAGLLYNPKFRSGFDALERTGLNFDAWMYFHQIQELVDLARAKSNVQIVLNHLGGPLGIGPYSARHHEVLVRWRSEMVKLVSCPNVVVKLGGIGMPMFGTDWHKRSEEVTSEDVAVRWGKVIRWCIENFGVDRCMFESNFPPDKVSFSYVVLWNAFKRIVFDASPTEKSALFFGTAARVYRL
jgi:L-fuconolactonase